MSKTIDLTRCKRCRKRPRGKLKKASFEHYFPYCSYHCQEWAKTEAAQECLAMRRAQLGLS